MAREKVLVAMSGGVDSSVAAALLLERGYEPIGATMRLWTQEEGTAARQTCCSLDDANDARRVADQLGIPHYVLNMKDEFRRHVVDYFIGEYCSGRTPNPCIACNRELKFNLLLKKAEQLGAEKLATGHYARIIRNETGHHLLRGRDAAKDQSYFLFDIPTEKLGRILFPLGDITKEEARAVALRLGLKTAAKAESQEICFIPDDDYEEFIRMYAPPVEEGDFLDDTGNPIGKHRGIPFYTVGQRRRLGISAGSRRYVTAIEPETNTVVLGNEAGLLADSMEVGGLILHERLEEGKTVGVQVRYRRKPSEARIRFRDSGQATVSFASPERAVAPGQAAVFYLDDTVAGGGWIESFKKSDG